MLWQDQLLKTIEKLQSRDLKPADLAVLMGLAAYADLRSCRVYATSTTMAKRLGMSLANYGASFKRLYANMLVNKKKDPISGSSIILINPYVLSTGDSQERGIAWRHFKESFS